MPKLDKFIEPAIDKLTKWFIEAHGGDQCQVLTKQGQLYAHLIKVSPVMVKWKVSGFKGQDTTIVNTVRFEDLLETWNDFA
jgi:hypothetical protein